MCLLLYVAADHELPLIKWTEEAPTFYVTRLSDDEKGISKRFTKPFVYYAGSHQGCGCGFSYGQHPIETREDAEEDKAARKSVKRLADYLKSNLDKGPVELFAIWDGDQEADPVGVREIRLSQIGGDCFKFTEKERLILTRE